MLESLMLPITAKEKIHIMKSKIFLLLGLLTCKGNNQTIDSGVGNTVCLQPIVDGTYDVSFDTLSSKCGTMDDVRLNVVYGIPSPQKNAQCHLVNVQNLNQSCNVDANFHCDDGLWKMKMDWNTKSRTTSPNTITGILYVEMERFTGWTCEGTYSFQGLKNND